MRTLSLGILFAVGTAFSYPVWSAPSETKLVARVTLSATGTDPEIIHAEYRLSRPVSKLTFDRTAPGLRSQIWKVETPGLVIKDDAITALDGSSFDHVLLRVEPYSGFAMSFDYAPAAIYSDGSLTLYTGHFDIAGEGNETLFNFRSEVTPVILLGKQIQANETWKSDGMGTFVYFGQIKPINTEHSVLILDPTLPKWMNEVLTTDTPIAVQIYTKEYASELGYRPFLLFSWMGRDDSKSTDLNGDTLPGAIRYRLAGASWGSDTPQNREELARVVAHEVGHLWNSFKFHPAQSEGGSWLSEGQSESVAIYTANKNGWIAKDYALQRYSDLITECVNDIDTRPIATQQTEEAVYGCGVTFNLLAQAAIAQKGDKDGLFTLWRTIFTNSSKNAGVYSVEDFATATTQLSGDAELAALVVRLSEQSSSDKHDKILSELHHYGFQYELTAPPVDDLKHGRIAMQPLMSDVMANDCGGHARFEATHDSYRIQPVSGCHIFAVPYVITKINGYAVFAQTALVYDSVVKSCATTKKLKLSIEGIDKPLAVECPVSLPPLPLAVALLSTPW